MTNPPQETLNLRELHELRGALAQAYGQIQDTADETQATMIEQAIADITLELGATNIPIGYARDTGIATYTQTAIQTSEQVQQDAMVHIPEIAEYNITGGTFDVSGQDILHSFPDGTYYNGVLGYAQLEHGAALMQRQVDMVASVLDPHTMIALANGTMRDHEITDKELADISQLLSVNIDNSEILQDIVQQWQTSLADVYLEQGLIDEAEAQTRAGIHSEYVREDGMIFAPASALFGTKATIVEVDVNAPEPPAIGSLDGPASTPINTSIAASPQLRAL